MFFLKGQKEIETQSQINEEIYQDNKKNIQNKSKNNKSSIGSRLLNSLQGLGKTLQFPIAVLPFAAILNRFGALGLSYSMDGDTITNQAGYWISFIIQKPGGIIFDNLPLMFAIGVGFGFAKDNRGEAALASVAFFLVTNALLIEGGLANLLYDNLHAKGLTFTNESGTVVWSKLLYTPEYSGEDIIGGQYQLNTGVFGGIVAGALTAFVYNKYKNITLPKALSFFGGRRFIPMMAILIAIPVAFSYAIIWPWIQFALAAFATSVGSSDAKYGVQIGGVFVFGILNRLLLAFGLHMVLNSILWFQIPITGVVVHPGFSSSPVTDTTATVNGDINAFTAGIFGSGNFQSGFFPVMMGGLPAAVIAMIFVAPKENRASVAGFLGGAAGVSFLTGITEPIEYSFIFLSPVLLIVHAVFTGISHALVVAMQMHVGFGFSAGFIDYAISIPQSWAFSMYQLHGSGLPLASGFGVTGNPLWMIPMIVLFAALYFFTFYFLIKKLDIKTPGREDDYVASGVNDKKTTTGNKIANKYVQMAQEIVDAIGIDNIEVVDNCATRLRLELKDNKNIDSKRIKATGVYGTKTLGTKSLQIVVGPDVEHVANAMHDITKK